MLAGVVVLLPYYKRCPLASFIFLFLPVKTGGIIFRNQPQPYQLQYKNSLHYRIHANFFPKIQIFR